MIKSEFLNTSIEMKHKIELKSGQDVLMRISRTGKSAEFVDVLLKAVQNPDSSWQLSAVFDNKNQVIKLGENNSNGEISTEDCICKRDVPYINLTPIIPQSWHETIEIFRQYKAGEMLLNPTNNFEIYSPLPNISFKQIENDEGK